MPADLNLSTATLYSFVGVLARVAGIVTFVPIPGLQAGPSAVRTIFALSMTMALAPAWPAVNPDTIRFSTLIGGVLTEALLGITLGLIVSFLVESFVFGAQILSLQAGYSYATTIDPTGGADSSVLVVIVQWAAGLLFFSFGWDHHLLRALAHSFQTTSFGTWPHGEATAKLVAQLGSTIFSTGLRFAMPLIGLLLIADLALALLSRMNAQIQLASLSFSLKMLVALAVLGWLTLVMPRLFQQTATHLLPGMLRYLGW
jgi:flagellar biosynthetic protein FliR